MAGVSLRDKQSAPSARAATSWCGSVLGKSILPCSPVCLQNGANGCSFLSWVFIKMRLCLWNCF